MLFIFLYYPPFESFLLSIYKTSNSQKSSVIFKEFLQLLHKIISSHIKSAGKEFRLQRIKRLKAKKVQLLYSSLFWQYPLHYIASKAYNVSTFRIYEIEILMSNKLLFMITPFCRWRKGFSFF